MIHRYLLDHEENREGECRENISQQPGQAARKRIELGAAELRESVAAGEAGIQKSERVALRKRPHMR